MHVAPNGTVFLSGPGPQARYLDTAGTGAWTPVATSSLYRDYGSSVLYDNGKVLIVGGGGGRGGSTPPTNTAEVIDLNAPSPAWRTVAPMAIGRRHLNATLLPDGTVLVNGGTSGAGFNNTTTPVFAAELWNPATETWTTLASALIPRLYHSAALLLPDGRVLTTGGDNTPQTEIFEPPYLFKGSRPTITAAPPIVTYGEAFLVETPDAASVTQVTWLRLSSVTHAFNMNQRINRLAFAPAPGGLTVTAPPNANLAPPGHYMLFLLNGNGVPSVAKIVQIGPPSPIPVLSGLAPNSATAGDPALTLTVTGNNFFPLSVVQWNGAARPTTFVDSSQLQAAIPASDLAAPGTAQVTVVNPAPGGGTSNALPFTINPAPAPALNALAPKSATAGDPAFTLTVTGSNFIAASTVHWDGAARPTTFINSGQLQAAIPASDLASPGTPQVTVVNPAPGGGTSNALSFTVSPPRAPALNALAPGSATAGASAFTLAVTGDNFIPASVVQWDGAPRPTTFITSSQLQAAIPDSDLAAVGTPQVTVVTPAPGGGTSNALPFTIVPPVVAPPELIGRWSSVPDLPFFPVHVHLLPTGKAMIWGGATISGDNAHLWDPHTAATTPVSLAGFDIFCSGHSLLGDGRLLVAGGNLTPPHGVPYASIYDPVSNVWTRLPDMNAGRWYPTVTTLASGDALVTAGFTETGANNTLPQVWQAASGTWRDLTNAVVNLPLYPWMYVAANGQVFLAGPATAARYLDTSGTGAWTLVATSSLQRDYGSSVIYDEGKVLIVGGGIYPPTNSTQVIDLNAPVPAWRTVAPMAYARRHLNATLLPDGTVLVNGGTSGAGFDNATTPVFAAELWNPATETWTTLAGAVIPRLYHSAALLLPDGRVLTTGGNYYPQTEVFEPPYLFKGPRPTITAAPPTVTYGEAFLVETPDAASVTQVTWLRLSSVTHAFNMNQRINRLAFAPGPGGLTVTAPPNANLAPPGHYMLFLLNGDGVPSVAKIIQIAPTNPVPVLSSLVPNSATAGDPAVTLTVTGSNFVPSSVVHWDGAARPTTSMDSGQLQAAIPASDLAVPGTPQVTVVNPAPGGGTSNALPLTINPAPNPVPALTSLSPTSAKRGGPAFTLTVTGSNFIAASVVHWNGAPRPTTFINSGELRAAIPTSDLNVVGAAQVTVVNPAPGGGISNTQNFQITR
jgi:hypothetical protein